MSSVPAIFDQCAQTNLPSPRIPADGDNGAHHCYTARMGVCVHRPNVLSNLSSPESNPSPKTAKDPDASRAQSSHNRCIHPMMPAHPPSAMLNSPPTSPVPAAPFNEKAAQGPMSLSAYEAALVLTSMRSPPSNLGAQPSSPTLTQIETELRRIRPFDSRDDGQVASGRLAPTLGTPPIGAVRVCQSDQKHQLEISVPHRVSQASPNLEKLGGSGRFDNIQETQKNNISHQAPMSPISATFPPSTRMHYTAAGVNITPLTPMPGRYAGHAFWPSVPYSTPAQTEYTPVTTAPIPSRVEPSNAAPHSPVLPAPGTELPSTQAERRSESRHKFTNALKRETAPAVIKTRRKSRKATKCLECGTTETPEWRRGPDGARTLCNACGLYHAKLVKKWGDLGAIEMLKVRANQRKNGLGLSGGSTPP